MKIFITKKHPTTTFIYKVLNFIKSKCSEKEFLSYVQEVLKKEEEGKPKMKEVYVVTYTEDGLDGIFDGVFSTVQKAWDFVVDHWHLTEENIGDIDLYDIDTFNECFEDCIAIKKCIIDNF